MEFDKHDLEIDGDRVWLLDADGQRLCDLNDMRLRDFEWRISVEGCLLIFVFYFFFFLQFLRGAGRQWD